MIRFVKISFYPNFDRLHYGVFIFLFVNFYVFVFVFFNKRSHKIDCASINKNNIGITIVSKKNSIESEQIITLKAQHQIKSHIKFVTASKNKSNFNTVNEQIEPSTLSCFYQQTTDGIQIQRRKKWISTRRNHYIDENHFPKRPVRTKIGRMGESKNE